MKNFFNFLKLLFLAGLCINTTLYSQSIELIPKKTLLQPVKKKTKLSYSNTFDENWIEKYEEIGPFFEGLAAAKKYGKWGFINNNGDEVIPFIYDAVTSFYEGKVLVIKNEKYFYINKKGKCVKDCP
jgi:hypothetical protein